MSRVSRHNSSRGDGFTLVELLVVIGIIAVLIGILLPVLAKSRETANDIACRSNLRQIAIATRMYSNDFDDNIPDAYALGGATFRRGRDEINPFDPTSVPEVYGPGPLYYGLKYLRNEQVWICPSQTDQMKSYKNTYWNATFWRELTYNSDVRTTKLRSKLSREQTWWIGDNILSRPYLTGVRRFRTESVTPYTIPQPQQLYPHRYRVRLRTGTGRKGSINMCFIDGHVGVVVFNIDTGKSEVLRSP